MSTRNRRTHSLVSILSPSGALDPPLSLGSGISSPQTGPRGLSRDPPRGPTVWQDALAEGRCGRVPSHWQTEFVRWVADFGVSRIVTALADDPGLRVTNQAVYEWLQGHAPRPARAMALVELSGGRLTI